MKKKFRGSHPNISYEGGKQEGVGTERRREDRGGEGEGEGGSGLEGWREGRRGRGAEM